jgi:hypothetical protein
MTKTLENLIYSRREVLMDLGTKMVHMY